MSSNETILDCIVLGKNTAKTGINHIGRQMSKA